MINSICVSLKKKKKKKGKKICFPGIEFTGTHVCKVIKVNKISHVFTKIFETNHILALKFLMGMRKI